MPKPPAEVLAWVANVFETSSRVVVGRELPQSRSNGPWLLEIDSGKSTVQVVLHLDDATDAGAVQRFTTEAAALELAERHGLATPRLLATDLDGSATDRLVMLQRALPGSSRIPFELDSARLRDLGREIGAIHSVTLTPTPALPSRRHPLDGVDFAALTLPEASADLLARARVTLAEGIPSDEPNAFVHGDFWQGNTLWDGHRHTGTVDWDFAGVGPAGVDLGSARCDVAIMYGPPAADEVLTGWEEVQGAPAINVGWWDAVAATCTPPDLAMWLPNFHAQGRQDLDLPTVTGRRDAFLAGALRQIG